MITVTFDGNGKYTIDDDVWQYDYGQQLTIAGLDGLPSAVEIDFATKASSGTSVTIVGVKNSDGSVTVSIPDSLLGASSSGNIYAFVYLTDSESGETMKRIQIPVTARPARTDYTETEGTDDPFADVLETVAAALEEISHYTGLDELKEAVATLNTNTEAMDEDIAELQERVTELEGNGGSDYDIDYEDSTLTLYENGEPKTSITIVSGSGSGSGGSSNGAILTVTNTTGWLAKTIASESSCTLSFYWSSIEDELETGSGVLKVSVGGVTKMTSDIAQGDVTVNIADYLGTGSNKVKLTITDVYENMKTITFTITVVAISLTSSFDATTAYDAGSTVTYTCIPTGSATKTMYYIVDGEEVATATVTTSGRQISQVLPAMEHGAHTLLVYFTATIDGAEVQSNELYYELIVVDSDETSTIITSSYTGGEVDQYETITISYIVYSPSSLTSEVELYVDGVLKTGLSVSRSEQTWTYRADTAGEHTLTISSNSQQLQKVATRRKSLTIRSRVTPMPPALSAAGRTPRCVLICRRPSNR
ncbi:MAG: hypothetical protein LIO92_13085 [Clostridiales bacterium]|nr:hypothetical protein [Clostridiales bacterium]